MELQELQRHWDKLAEHDALWAVTEHADARTLYASGQQHIDELFVHAQQHGIAIPTNGAALDFGCGVGRLSLALAQRFPVVDGIDVSASMLEQGKKLIAGQPGADRVRFHLSATPKLPFEDGTFSFVYSFITLQHIAPEYSRGYIAEFVRMLKPDGVAAFHVPYAIHGGATHWLRQHLPGLAAILWYLKRGVHAVIQAHALPVAEVRKVVTDAGGIVLHIEEGLGDARVPGARYFVRRAQ